MATVAKVAAEAGVSPSTVSRVLSGKAGGLISQATQERIHEVAARLGYRPSAAAQALATGRARTVAFCCYPAYDSGMARLLHAVHDPVRAAGYHLLLVHPETTEEVGRLLVEQRVDAVVWVHYPVHEADALVESLGAPHQIVIAIGEMQDAPPQLVSSAVWHDHDGMSRILQHLTELGHQHVAFLQGHVELLHSKLQAFERVCAEMGLRHDIIRCADESDRITAGAEMTRQVLQSPERPTALVTRIDDFAFGAMQQLQNAGLRVPEDMSVVGYHDTFEARHSCPPLTSLRTPELQGIASLMPFALAALDSPDDEPTVPVCLHLQTELVLRSTTSPPTGK
ncbi:MAG: LacI family DNA-binding transcriptional regulator [Armatimonadia bacterium]